MNITFLIGNGFDIGMGLKSKFTDYFPQYIEESKNKVPIIKAFSEELKVEKASHSDNKEIDWADFETAIGKYAGKFTIDNKDNYFAQLRDFEVGFGVYLEKEQEQLEYDKEKICKHFLSALKTFYLNNNLTPASAEVVKNTFKYYEQQARVYNFVSFNYTEVLQKCLDCIPNKKVDERKAGNIDKIDSVVYVHGQLGNSPIMGVNDESQIINKELAKDDLVQSYLIKPKNNEENGSTNDKKATNLINHSDVICIYGMSLGATDNKWWQLIVKWLNDDVHRQLIVFVWDDKFNDATQFDRITKKNEVIGKLRGFMQNVKINVTTLKSRIHIAIHKNIFALNLRKTDNNEETTEPNETDKRDAV